MLCICICAYVSACVSVSACTYYGMCGGLRRSCQSPFPPPTMCNSGIELRSTGLTASSFYTLSHLAGPSPELLQPSVTNSHPSLHSLSLDCHVHIKKGKKGKYQNGKAISGSGDMNILCQNLSKYFILSSYQRLWIHMGFIHVSSLNW